MMNFDTFLVRVPFRARLLAIAATAALLAGLTACSSPSLPASSMEQTTSADQTVSSVSTATSNAAATQTVDGILVDATMSTITIQTADGSRYTFDKSGAQVTGDGLVIGKTVALHLRGTLQPGETLQTALVTAIVVYPTDDSTQRTSTTTTRSTRTSPSTSRSTSTAATTSTTASASAVDRVEQLLSELSLEEKVGQMFIARCPQTHAAQQVSRYHLGGYILFARDFENKTKSQVIRDIESYQQAADLPMLIGVDEEGGTVNRISRYPAFRAQPFASPQELYQEGGWNRIVQDTIEKSTLLKELGISLNFAPVCDVSQDPKDYIYPRTFGQNAAQTAVYIRTVVRTMKQQGMGSVLKHFPGYGNNADTHAGMAYDPRPYETFVAQDFLPFQAGIEAGANVVLVSHNVVNCMDPDYPASLSAKVHRVLREELQFAGVILTDDLAMKAIQQFTGHQEAAVIAVQAGNDLLCCTDFETQIPAVIQAVKTGVIPESQIDQSVRRILNMKIALGLIG